MKQQMRRKKNKGQNGESRVTVPKVPGFPDQIRVSLVYEDLIQVSTVTNSYYTQIFRGNSLFDPDLTGIGHQPRYFDQYAAIYNKYKVYSSKIELFAANGSAVAPVALCVLPLTDQQTSTLWYQAAEMPRAKSAKHLIPIGYRYPVELDHTITTNEIIGLQPGQINDEDYGALVTGSPAQVWYWNCFLQSVDQTTTLSVGLRVRITYDSLFYDKTYVGPS